MASQKHIDHIAKMAAQDPDFPDYDERGWPNALVELVLNVREDAERLRNAALGLPRPDLWADLSEDAYLHRIAENFEVGAASADRYMSEVAGPGLAIVDAAVPPGMALVPVEPTEEMIAAYLKANTAYWARADELPSTLSKWRNGTPERATAESYAAMLAACGASTPPAPADELEKMRARKDAAYEERNKVVAALARLFPSGIARTAIEGWSEDWHGCVYIDLPTGQVSWHFHDSQAHLFDGLPPYTSGWDGHDTHDKYVRLARLGASPCDGKDPRGCWNVRCQLGEVCCRQSGMAVKGE